MYTEFLQVFDHISWLLCQSCEAAEPGCVQSTSGNLGWQEGLPSGLLARLLLVSERNSRDNV